MFESNASLEILCNCVIFMVPCNISELYGRPEYRKLPARQIKRLGRLKYTRMACGWENVELLEAN